MSVAGISTKHVPRFDSTTSRTATAPERHCIDDLLLTRYQKQELEQFCARISNTLAWRPIELLVFGSAARGRSYAFSDIDVAVVSDFFEGIPWEIRLKHLAKYIDPGSAISPVGVTSEELTRGQSANPSILRSIHPPHAIQIEPWSELKAQ